MQATIYKVSDNYFCLSEKINTIQDIQEILKKFDDKNCESVIINFYPTTSNNEIEIFIYDDYFE